MEFPPRDAELVFQVSIYGKPVPAGSKNGFAVRYKDSAGIWRVKIVRGKGGHESAIVTVSDINASDLKERAKVVRHTVESAFGEYGFRMPPPGTPLATEAIFCKPRPKDHYRTGRFSHLLRDDARHHWTTTPDTTKIWRGLEDSLTGVVWQDDSDIVDSRIAKRYVWKDEQYRVDFSVWTMPPIPLEAMNAKAQEIHEASDLQINLLS